jgi:uncharacterized protein (TIGR03437 family)
VRHLRTAFLLQLLCVGFLGAQTLSRVSGNGQIVFELFPAKAPLVVQAKDAAGNPVAGVPITWSISPANSATLVLSDNVTDANGLATTGFVAPAFLQFESFKTHFVTASSPNSSVSFVITSVTERQPNGNFAGDPFITLVSPVQDNNRTVTGQSGTTLPAGVVVSVFSQAGLQANQPLPNIGLRILNNLDRTAPSPAVCNGPEGTVLTDSRGVATCDLVISGAPGTFQLVAIVGEIHEFVFNLIVTPGAACKFSLSSAGQGFPAIGGTGSVNVVTTAGCTWTAANNAPSFLNITGGAGGTGNGTLAYSVAANTGAARSGTLTIAGQSYSVTQSAVTTTGLAIITPANLPAATVGSNYGVTLAASGGQLPYTWSVLGVLPSGLSLAASTGVISGQPATSGTSAFTIKVTDNTGASQTQSFNLPIGTSGTSSFSITNTTFPNGAVGQAYQTLLTTSGGCVSPFSPSPNFTLSAGSLPAGLTLQINSDGSRSIAGTPTAAGSSNFTLTATDSCGKTATASFTITISGTPLTAQMQVSNSSLAFVVQAGITTTPADQTISITSTGGTVGLTLAYTAAITTQTGGNWLVARNSTTGNTPSTLTVGIANFSTLAAGTYSGAISITSSASNSPVVIPVTLTVAGTVTTLSVSPSSFVVNQIASFTATPTRLNLAIASSGATVHYSVLATTTSNLGWLTVSPTSGDTPSVVTATVNANGLAAGVYTGNIVIQPVGGAPQAVMVTLNILPGAAVVASPSPLGFTYLQGASIPTAQNLVISSTGPTLGISVVAATLTGGNWLFIDQTAGITPVNLRVSINPTGLTPGPYTGAITITPSDQAVAPFTVLVNLTVNAAVPTIASITNAASFAPGPISPGEFITIFGSSIGPATPAGLQLTADGKVSTNLANTQVFFDNFPAAMVYASNGQVSAIVPYELTSGSTTLVKVVYQGVSSNVTPVRVIDSAPAIFVADSTGQGAILNQDFSANSVLNGATPGSFISIYATGEGQTNPPGIDGLIAGPVLPRPLLDVSAKVDGLTADVSYSGAAQGLASGVIQVNVRIPQGVRRGISVPVQISVGAASSQAGVTVAIK